MNPAQGAGPEAGAPVSAALWPLRLRSGKIRRGFELWSCVGL